ncbi:peptidase S51 dipeptidase E [Cytobacillus depressus]|uniref:Peptidase S51 dipeptidase E n=1 Tax=Cytobacillus depressus TaxID=1602942 RepID=A0A6L3V2Z4_9BACI|nr:Type 1 glutamine amidotransferase-like domain-containing protein [Cytobacillus depressus]KAB2334411.1 peptidase S51 dipeptidase E [Cytobacillus depressus]
MKSRHLFMFGGGPPFSNKLGKRFTNLALNEKGKVAILFLERDGWEKYMDKYTSMLKGNGLGDFVYLPVGPEYENKNLIEFKSCSGIIIGGGETELYQKYIVDTPIGERLKELYNHGVPVAGFSAGALISPKNCVIPPIDNAKNKQLFLKGLGLIPDCVISVHFSKWNEEENLKIAMEKVNASIGYGMDDGAGIYFFNENPSESEGDYYIYQNIGE